MENLGDGGNIENTGNAENVRNTEIIGTQKMYEI